MTSKLEIKSKYSISILVGIFLAMNLKGQEIVHKTIETIVIDAGHGGKDPGALGRYSKEKDITLSIALKTGKLIQEQHPNVKVIYTRKTDNFVELYERANIANRAKADLFISIHANSSKNRDANGVEFYVLGLHKADENLDVAKKENAVVNYEGNVNENYGFDPNTPEGNIMMTMKQSLYLDKSVKMAKTIENNFSNQTNQVIRGTRQAGFVVLYKTSMPSVLVETGFISNPDEENYISSSNGQTEIASKIANAFTDYKANFENATVIDLTNNEKINDVILAESTSAPRQTIDLTAEPAKSDPGVSYFNKYQNDLDSEKEKTTKQMNNAKQIVKQETVTETITNNIIETPTKVTEQDIDVVSSVTKTVQEPVIDLTQNYTEEFQKQFGSSNTSTTTTTNITSTDSRVLNDDELNKVKIREFNNLNSSTPSNSTSTYSSSSNANVSDLAYEIASNSTSLESTSYYTEEVPKTTKSTSKPSKSSTKTTPKTGAKAAASVPSYVNNNTIKEEIIENTQIIDFTTPSLNSPSPTYSEPIVETSSPATSSSNAGTVYKIQVKASAAKASPTDPIFKISEKITTSQEGGYYKYLVGNYSNRDQAASKLNQIKSKGIKDAFIVKYQNGIRQ